MILKSCKINMKIKDICKLSTRCVIPCEDVAYHLYSLPAFDANQEREEVLGRDIHSSKWSVPDKCILFNKLNVRFKRVWCIDNLDKNKLASTEFLPLVVDENKIDFLYCYYLLISDAITNYLCGQNSNTSGSHKRIDSKDFLNIDITLPPMTEQRAIGKMLANIDRKIALNRQTNRDLEALAKQLYDYWFVQFDFPNEEGKPYKSSGGAMVWNEELKREIPQGWKDDIFANIANITMGQSPDGSSYNETGEGEIFYQGSADFGIRFPSVRMYTTSPTRFAKQGDILMSVRAPVGAVNIANADCCIGRGLSAIKSKIGSITYIYYVIHYLKVRFDSLNTAGTTFGSITKDELFNLPVVIPSNDVIERFEAICKPIFEKQMGIGFEIESLTKQRDELLPLLMNGQVSLLNCD